MTEIVQAIDKRRVLQALRQRLTDKLEALTASQRSAQSGAFHEENRQENPKDTRAIEASYLARGLAARVETLRDAIGALAGMEIGDFAPDRPISIGALILLQNDDGDEQFFFLAPSGGGERLDVDGTPIQSLTPTSPLGNALIGKVAGDEIVAHLPKGTLRASLVAAL